MIKLSCYQAVPKNSQDRNYLTLGVFIFVCEDNVFHEYHYRFIMGLFSVTIHLEFWLLQCSSPEASSPFSSLEGSPQSHISNHHSDNITASKIKFLTGQLSFRLISQGPIKTKMISSPILLLPEVSLEPDYSSHQWVSSVGVSTCLGPELRPRSRMILRFRWVILHPIENRCMTKSRSLSVQVFHSCISNWNNLSSEVCFQENNLVKQ